MEVSGKKRHTDNTNVVSCKWVYRIKENHDDGTLRFKARLVFRGFEQTDCGETFAPVPKLATIRMLFALAAVHDWDISQMDVVTAFLHPTIDEDVYMELPEGYSVSNGISDATSDRRFDRSSNGSSDNVRCNDDCRRYVCKLYKALYGLKQAPRAWYADIDKFLV